MIRFSCGNCGKPLRAPVGLAGKKGRCAQCGAVNGVPALPVNVEVKRAGAVSPFRSTADVPVQREVVAVQNGPAVSTAVAARPGDFFDHVASRMTALADPLDHDIDVPRAASVSAPPPRAMEDFHVRPVHLAPPHSAHHHGPAIVVVAMGVGLVVGICLGLLMAKWVL